ncbi:sigma 54-interacting transcriptional regulator [Calderihabitans maritimus]|uniref:Fis family transcriptional regulator n=1 Tax=Calderihabitans maritimus TaxID=1246530 RepID=A0A1Z5HTG3_9FIRM|nr:sigma 54-interacting transcriptional regulator [Calderihabitans maritimus]GAW92819.1 Fis family transcriptional regulator [Calderihabitans maritimus]
MSKILITSPYPEFTVLARQICVEMEVEAIILEKVLEEAAASAQELVQEGEVEVVISRAGTAAAIERVVNVPVVTAEYTDFDLLQALWNAKKLGDKIGFLGFRYKQIEYDFDSLVEILGTEVKQYLYGNTREIEEQVEKAYKDGIEVIVGGGYIGVRLARQKGMQGVLVYTSRRALVQAIQRAIDILRIIRKDREKEERLKTIIHAANEGIIAVDENGVITVFNPGAEKILGIAARQVVGKSISAVTANDDLLDLLKGQEEIKGDLRQVGESQVIVNRMPVKVGGQTLGIILTLQDVTRIQQLEQRIRKELYTQGLVAKFSFNDIIYRSKVMKDVIASAEKFAETDSTVLITGESGTGKELIAQSIHQSSKRRTGPFVAVNCAALPESLLESELFGYAEGAFTGARRGGKAGLFELAHGGTIFLDEIGKISLELQARLLRVLQEKEVMRVGGDRIIPVDIRVIAATNQNLRAAVQQGAFRDDLFYRLNVLKLTLPPLRERKEDIPLLVEHFLRKFNAKFGKTVQSLPAKLMEWFLQYDWPGNVRELENFVERFVILADGDELEPNLLEHFREDMNNAERENYDWDDNSLVIEIDKLDNMVVQIIRQLDKRVGGNRSELARLLGVSRTTLWKKLKQLEE